MAAIENYTLSDIQVFVPSIIGQALSALNQYMGLVVLLGIVGGIAISLTLLMKSFKHIGR